MAPWQTGKSETIISSQQQPFASTKGGGGIVLSATAHQTGDKT
jgi:hypothetical protein